jgi:PadR family transcriptional regulator PadR
MNMTYPSALVLQALSMGHHYGLDIIDATGLSAGTVYPVLRRLEREGLANARWESEKIARREQRPTRRYYDITSSGEKRLAEAVRRFRVLEAAVRTSHALRPSEG